ncbi:MAG: DNA repair protein RadC [Oscillospiraceae bacterium]
MREKFLTSGIGALAEHEVLEMLLFFTVPRVNTNETAHRLLRQFGSLTGVLDAPADELFRFGLNENSVVLLKMIPSVLKLYSAQSAAMTLDSIRAISAYFQAAFVGATEEEIKVCCLDDRLSVIACPTVSTGTVKTVTLYARKVVEIAFRHNCALVILAHNHPGGDALPSDADISVTRQLINALAPLGIRLLDHVIVSRTGTTSMKAAGYFNIFD